MGERMHDMRHISIHTPLAGSDLVKARTRNFNQISIHTPLAGSDRWTISKNRSANIFQSTLPLRGVTRSCGIQYSSLVFQSTLPLRGVT